MCHVLKLRATHAGSIVFRRDQVALLSDTIIITVCLLQCTVFAVAQAALEYSQFSMPLADASAVAVAQMPFRLSRNLLHFVTPLGVNGVFTGSFSAAAESMARRRKCPVSMWLALLSRNSYTKTANEVGGAARIVPIQLIRQVSF